MPTLVNLTFDIADLIGADFDARRTKVWIETNIASGSVIDTTGKVVRLGDVKATMGADGKGTFTGLFATNSSDLNPTGFLYQVYVDHATRADGRKLWGSGWFSLTVSSDLATVTPVVSGPANSTDDAVIASRIDDPASLTRAALNGVYVEPSVIYVSSPTGNNANAGTAPGKPKATIAAALTALTNGGTVRLLRSTHAEPAPITIDVSKHQLVGAPNGSIVTFSNTTGVAVTVTGTNSVATSYTVDHAIRDVTIRGAGSGNVGTVGLDFNSATASTGVVHKSFLNLQVRGFETGLKFRSETYILTFLNAVVWECATGIHTPSGITNGGERITFVGGVIQNNSVRAVLAENPNGALMFESTSIDYNGSGRQFDIVNSHVYLTDCHVECYKTDANSMVSISGDGAHFRMSGGWFVNNNNGAQAKANIVANTCPYNAPGVEFTGVFMANLAATSGYFASGSGKTVLDRTALGGSDVLTSAVAVSMNRLADGAMGEANVADDWHITADTAAITNRLTGANLSIAKATDQLYQTNTKSLKITKVGGAGSAAQVRLLAPVVRSHRTLAKFVYGKFGTHTGTVYLTIYAAKAMVVGETTTTYRVSTMSQIGVTLTSADTPFTPMTVTGNASLPPWATHLIFDLNLDSMAAGAFHIGHAEVDFV